LNRNRIGGFLLLFVLVISIVAPFVPIVKGATYSYEIERQVSHDDADAYRQGLNYYRNEFRNTFTANKEQCTIGMVFYNITIPQGTTVTKAELIMDKRTSDSRIYFDGAAWKWQYSPTRYEVFAENTSNTENFGDWANFLGRMGDRTYYQSRYIYQTSNNVNRTWTFQVKNQIQTIVNKAAWVSGNNITLFIEEDSPPDPYFGDFPHWGWYSGYDYNTWGLSHDFDPNSAPILRISLSGPSTISGFENDPTESGYRLTGVTNWRVQQDNTFYSNYTRSFWTTAGIGSDKYISESIRENDWADWTRIITGYAPTGWDFDIWLEPNGRYFWIGYEIGQTGDGVWWRKGELGTTRDGSITWLTSPVQIAAWNQGGDWRTHHGGSIVTNKAGNPFIAWSRYNTGSGVAYTEVDWTDNTDGTMGSHYNAIGDMDGGPLYFSDWGESAQSTFTLLPSDTELGVYLVHSDVETTPVQERLDVWHYDGVVISDENAWATRGQVVGDSYTYYNNRGYAKWDASSNWKGFVGIVYVDDDGSPPTQLIYNSLNNSDIGTAYTGQEEILEARTQIVDDNIRPQVVVDDNNNSLVMWVTKPINERSDEIVGNSTIYYKIRWNNGTWGNVVQWKNLTFPINSSIAQTFEDANFDINYNTKDMREYEITSYDGLNTTTYESFVSDTAIDTGLIYWNTKLWLADNWTDTGGFYNASFRLSHSTISMRRINAGDDQWVYTPFYLSSHFKNYSQGSPNKGVGLISYHNSGNNGPTTWKWGLFARNGSVVDSVTSGLGWGPSAQNHWIDVRMFSANNTIVARLYDDLTFSNLIDTMTLTNSSVIYGVYNYSWGIQQRYSGNTNYGIDVDGIWSMSESNEFDSIGISDTLRSPISVLFTTAGGFWSYHDYLFLNETEGFFGTPFWTDYNYTFPAYPNSNNTLTCDWDDTNLDKYIFSHNGSGAWVNDTAVAFLATPDQAVANIINPAIAGTVVGFNWYANNTDGFWNSTGIITFNISMVVSYINTTVTTDSGLAIGGWMFEGEIYHFTSYVIGATEFYLNFSDGQHEIRLNYDNYTQQLYITAGERFVIGDIFTNYTLIGAVQRLDWRFIPDINIVDAENVTVNWYVHNDIIPDTITGDTGIYFNIYNLGGFTYYYTTGNGTRTIGGHPFEIMATNGTGGSSSDWIRAEQIYRKLQSVHFLIELDLDFEWDDPNGEFDQVGGIGDFTIGIDYYLNDSWRQGWFVELYPSQYDVGHHDGANDHNWVKWGVNWYNYNATLDAWNAKRIDYIYSNNWGYEHENYVPDYHNRTSSQIWVDLWFDKTNASTTVAGQVNAYYHGVREQGSAWWFGYGVFTPMQSESGNSQFLDDLYDHEGNITNVLQYELMKLWVEVDKDAEPVDGDDETYRIAGIQDMHIGLAVDRMEGIDQPTFVQTKILDMPQTGFISAIKNAINNLSKLIWGGAFQFIQLIMGAAGSFMEAIGLGELWNAFGVVLDQMAQFTVELLSELSVAFTNTALLLTQLTNMVSLTIGRYVYFITAFIGSIIAWYQGIIQMFTGGGIFSIDVWTGLSIEDWFGLAMNLFPIWWLNRLGNSDDLFSTLRDDVSFAASITTGVFKFFIQIIMLAIALIDVLFGLLPI
jgi:hypothetical protein